MVYKMEIYVDGGCRGNGQPGSVGAGVAVFKLASGDMERYYEVLDDSYDPPTNQRAEITAIKVALEQALRKYDELDSYPRLNVNIYSDSRYVTDLTLKHPLNVPGTRSVA